MSLVLCVSGCVTSEEAGPYPIWWSPTLELDSLDQIEALMGDRFPVHN